MMKTIKNIAVGILVADQHALPLSIALHLIPGALVVVAYELLAEPFVNAMHYPVFMAWAIALVLVLVPIMLCMLWLGYQLNGRFSLQGVVACTERTISRGKITAIIAALIVWMLVVSIALIPLDNFIFNKLFTWIPFEGAGGSATTYLAGYSHSLLIITMLSCLPVTGFILPLIEEIYFRGFLLPRLSQLRLGAPVLNTVLFATYHFWAPWTILSKVIFMFPGIYLVWRKRDIRFSIGMHAGSALLMATMGTIAIIMGYNM